MLVLVDPDDPDVPQFKLEVQHAASALKITTMERRARTQKDLEQIFDSVSRSNTDGVFIASLSLRVKLHSVIIRLATKQQVRRLAAGSYVDKILKEPSPPTCPSRRMSAPNW